MDSQMQKLESLEPLIMMAAKKAKLRGSPEPLDDLRQVARIAVWEALDRYDPGKSSLSTFMYRRINGAIVDHHRAMLPPGTRRKSAKAYGTRTVSLDEISTNEEGKAQIERLASVSPDPLEIEMHDAFQDCTQRLPRMMRVVLWLYYVEELSMALIAQRVNLSKSRVSQLHSEAIDRLKDRILQ